MALTFNAINRAAAFNPTQAFPLDKRSYFESYNLAVAAAQTAAEPGTDAASNTVYYFGQTLVVNENNKATLYIIQPNKTLKEVGSVPVGDDQSITVVDGKIQLVNFSTSQNGAVAQIKVADDGTRTLVWTQVSDLVGGEMADVAERVDKLEGVDGLGVVKTIDFNDTTDTLVFKDTKGNTIKSINLNIAAVTKSIEYMATVTISGTVYTNVLVLTDANNNKTVVELDDLLNIYTTEQNATDVQLTVTSTDGGTDADTNVISAKLTDSVKEAINKGVVAHEGLSYGNSDVQLNYSEELGEHRVLLKTSIKEDITKGATAYNALFDGTTTFVLNGGSASGYIVATDEGTEV